ncbi:pyridoxamine kinase [Megasphaera vaginalis (ex Bordigoni et al. 2020)]|uniref:pyridoxamine kinase n=1 Tax=Megasphaera vaginalis (ex Bordigoni et al. 2020) TaxID=2045301 RepID=UPI000C7E2BC4|nr:pyridoxamine kinase [Megasphaera vaginalis (ex Bordigoni et al. 2020)]
MKKQKKIAVVNDVTGFGRCAAAVQLPLISAMKVQACIFPTAILSVHTGFPAYYIDDYAERMPRYLDSWQENGLVFDGILTGFLGSVGQVDIVKECLLRVGREDSCIVVDPVMGDNGSVYASYTDALCRAMKSLLPYATIVTPNLTEACRLAERPYVDEERISDKELIELAETLAASGPSGVAITGLHRKNCMRTLVYEREKGASFLETEKVGGARSGTGDVFSAIVAAGVVQGMPLDDAVMKAMSFICRVLRHTLDVQEPEMYGLVFEEFLTEL